MTRTTKISKSPVYRAWIGAIQRCEQPNQINYKFYGARGIRVSQDWKDFAAFQKDMEASYQPGMSLLRRDRSGDFCKSNCFWGTPEQQRPGTRVGLSKPRRQNLIKEVFYEGRTYKRHEICEEHNVSKTRFTYRIRQGWTPAQIVLTPKSSRVAVEVPNDTSWVSYYGDGTAPPPSYVSKINRPIEWSLHEEHTINGVTKTLKAWCVHHGRLADTVRYRLIRLGWTLENALKRDPYR